MKAAELQAIVAAIMLTTTDKADNAAMDIAVTRAEALILKCDMQDADPDDDLDEDDEEEDFDDDDDEEDDDDELSMHDESGSRVRRL